MTNLGLIFSLLISILVLSVLVYSALLSVLANVSAIRKAEKLKLELSLFFSNIFRANKESAAVIFIMFLLAAEIFLSVPLFVSGFYTGSFSSGIFSIVLINSLAALSLYLAFSTGALSIGTADWLNELIRKISSKLTGKEIEQKK